ncbi:SGNH hydrolase, partial [Bimuria novae-zelandiae CBS 107.79]
FPLHILPLGASITWGQQSTDGNGYREHLRNLLQERSTVVDMVGSVQSGQMGDNNNEGHPGARLHQVARYAKVGRVFKPNLILINAGTNDVVKEDPEYPIEKIGERMDALVGQLFEENPGVTIILSTLLVNGHDDADKRIREIVNPQYNDIVKFRQQKMQRILLADLYSACKVVDLVDGTHPNDEGYKKVAEAWLKAIQQAGHEGLLVEPRHVV